MSGYLMDALLPQARLRALRTLAKAYAPMPLPVLHVHRALGFDGGACPWRWFICARAIIFNQFVQGQSALRLCFMRGFGRGSKIGNSSERVKHALS